MGYLKLYTEILRVTSHQESGDFSNKNIIDELGLAWLDFGARNYDAALGRWMNIDQMELFLNELKKRSTKPASDS